MSKDGGAVRQNVCQNACAEFGCSIKFSGSDNHTLCYRHRKCKATREGAIDCETNKNFGCSVCSLWSSQQWRDFHTRLRRRARDRRRLTALPSTDSSRPSSVPHPIMVKKAKKEKKERHRDSSTDSSHHHRRRDHSISSSAESRRHYDRSHSRSRSRSRHRRDDSHDRHHDVTTTTAPPPPREEETMSVVNAVPGLPTPMRGQPTTATASPTARGSQ